MSRGYWLVTRPPALPIQLPSCFICAIKYCNNAQLRAACSSDRICLGNIEFCLAVCFVVDLRIEFAYLLPCDVGHAKIFWLRKHTHTRSQCRARTYGYVNKHIPVDGPSHNNNNNRVNPFKAGCLPRPATGPVRAPRVFLFFFLLLFSSLSHYFSRLF